jgi:hypothetical protein
LDEKGADVMRAGPSSLKLGELTFSEVHWRVSELYAFSMMRTADQHGGLLGNSFFQQFARVDIDFERYVVRFVNR